MRQVYRRMRLRHGVSARRVAVRAQKPWYWHAITVLLVLLLGYGLGYWHFSAFNGWPLTASAQDRAMLAQLVLAERQLQVERAAQHSMAREMAALQGEVTRLKEDVAFYDSILSESGAAGVVSLHSVRIDKTEHPGEYRYQALLVQTGRHDKEVQGTLHLSLQGSEAGNTVARQLQQGIRVKFKYYQRIDGSFTLPEGLESPSLLVEFMELGSRRARLSKAVSLAG